MKTKIKVLLEWSTAKSTLNATPRMQEFFGLYFY